MTTLQDRVITDVVTRLNGVLGPKRILLFGSRAKGTARDGSDFDIAVTGSEPAGWNASVLDAARGLHRIDLIFLDDVDEDFRRVILETGKVIYDQSRNSGRA